MLISTEIGSFRNYGERKKVLRALKNAGFTAYDATMDNHYFDDILCEDDYISRAKELRAFADEIGLLCNQCHAPAPPAIPGDATYNKETYTMIVRSLEVCGILGVRNCIVQPANDYSIEENVELYHRLEPYAREAGVKIALENIYNDYGGWDNFKAGKAACSHHDDYKKYMELLPEDVFVACVDIGHAEMAGLNTSAVEMIETLGNRVRALHLHDNDKVHDNHNLPFTMSIEYQPIIEALKHVGYSGDITLEAYRYIGKFPFEMYPSAMRLMADTAEYFRRQVEGV